MHTNIKPPVTRRQLSHTHALPDCLLLPEKVRAGRANNHISGFETLDCVPVKVVGGFIKEEQPPLPPTAGTLPRRAQQQPSQGNAHLHKSQCKVRQRTIISQASASQQG